MKYKKVIVGGIFISLFFLTILLVFVLRGNFFRYNDINYMISEPQTHDYLITGSWKVDSVKSLENDDKNYDDKDDKNHKLYITKNEILFSDIYAKDLKFKFRYINLKNYLTSKAIITDKIKLDKEDVIIVSISDKVDYYQEFIVIDDDTIAMIKDKKYYVLKKESNKVNVKLNKNVDKEKKTTNREISFLIGLKSENKKGVEYKTFLIQKNKENKITFNKIDGLFVNKDNNFFLINSNTNNSIYFTKDYISLTNRKVLQANNPVINFLNENYISFETRNNENRKKNYEIHSIKNFKENSKLSINDIAGSNGENSYFETLKKLGYSNENITSSDMYNFGIKRENGRWIFKSIFNDISKKISTEVELDIIPKVDIFESKAKKIEKSVIQNKHSDFVDYFISPNEDMLVVLTTEELVVYSIKNNTLSTLPIASVNIFGKKDVVSFQWKTLENSELTYNEFLKIKQLDLKKEN